MEDQQDIEVREPKKPKGWKPNESWLKNRTLEAAIRGAQHVDRETVVEHWHRINGKK